MVSASGFAVQGPCRVGRAVILRDSTFVPPILDIRITYIPFNAGLVDNLIDIIGRHTRADGGSGDIQDLAREAADLSHGVLGLRIEDVDLRSAGTRAVLRDSILGPLGVRYAFGDDAFWRERVDGSEGAGVVEGRERVVDTSSWIWFRNYLRRDYMVENITLRFVEGLVLALKGGQLTVLD